MKIDSSAIDLASQHSSVERHSVSESLRMWVGDRRPDTDNRPRLATPQPSAQVQISDAARRQSRADNKVSEIADASAAAENDPKLKLLILMVEALTGRKIKLHGIDAGEQPAQPAQPAQNAVGWGLEYDYHESTYEAEQTSFSAQGVINTSDGQQIKFDLQLQMSREYYSETNVSIRAGSPATKDPLVINFDGAAAQLTDTKFSFDISNSGTPDDISFVAPGSGFLALDKNDNGKIDNGSELFGTQSGNGFADLALYDQDGNQWIDENDSIYAALRVWTKDAQGRDTLSTLKEKNVGALFLGNVATPFSAKNADNQLLGQLRSTGVYLHEDGQVGTLQQIDLAV